MQFSALLSLMLSWQAYYALFAMLWYIPTISQEYFSKISFIITTASLKTVVLWDIDLKFGMWICHDIIQIKFEFSHAWPTFTGVIALCWNLVFRTFLYRLLRYSLKIWYMNLSWHNTDQVWVSLRLTYFYRSYCPLLKFSFLHFFLLSFQILTWHLVYEFVLT